jgi:SAM-dependent methyltransferase
MAERSLLPAGLAERICCPRCKSSARLDADRVVCSSCGATYPTVAGIPVLFNEEASLFDNASAASMTAAPPRRTSRLKAFVRAITPSISRNYRADENYEHLSRLIAEAGGGDILVVGAGTNPVGLNRLLEQGNTQVVETDVVPGPRAGMICDAHDIPFLDDTFDAVVIQGVICWLQDPERAVAEIHRVLRPGGLVYAETPFVQQNTGGANDFVRYTHLGHRRLFRNFSEVESGPIGGPGMVLAWSWSHFLMSFASSRRARAILKMLAQFTAFWLPRMDRWLGRNSCAVDAASGVFFLGRSADTVISDRAIIEGYRGCVRL